MDKLINKFNSLKYMLSKRAAAFLGGAMLKSFLTSLDEYNDELVLEIRQSEKKIEEVKEENKLLLGLAGSAEPAMRSCILKQGEEVRFLREQLLGMKKTYQELCNTNDSLKLEIETLKSELTASNERIKNEQKFFKESLDDLNKQLNAFAKKIVEKEIEIEKKKNEVINEKNSFEQKIQNIEKELVLKNEKILYRIVYKLNGFCIDISEGLNLIIEKINNMAPMPRRGLKVFSLRKYRDQGITEAVNTILPDLNFISQRSADFSEKMISYIKLFENRPVKNEKVVWPKFWDNIKRRYSVVTNNKKIKIEWPSEKHYPDFITDNTMLLEICEILVQNAIESLLLEGIITIEGVFSQDATVLVFSDTGSGIKEENINMIFEPFFTTKSGHYGLGLKKAKYLLNLLGGSITFKPQSKGAAFVVTVPGLKEAAPVELK